MSRDCARLLCDTPRQVCKDGQGPRGLAGPGRGIRSDTSASGVFFCGRRRSKLQRGDGRSTLGMYDGAPSQHFEVVDCVSCEFHISRNRRGRGGGGGAAGSWGKWGEAT